MICALPAIRRHHYEAFYFLHILFVPLTLVMSALHHPPLAWWCWVALALWVAERSYRLTWWLNTNGYLGGTRPAGQAASPKKSATQVLPDTLPMHVLGAPNALSKLPTLPRIDPNAQAPGVSMADLAYTPPPGYAHAELMPGKTVRVRIVTPGFLSWAPGQHFLIRLPAVSGFTTHPFTVASVCDEQAPTDAGRELVFFIRAKKGWTKDLWDLVAGLCARGAKHPTGEKPPTPYHPPPRGVLLRASVDGPFGSAARARWNDHSTVLLMVGGSGVSFALSVLEYVCMCLAGRDGKALGGRSGGYGMPGYKTQRVRFVWIVREFGMCIPYSGVPMAGSLRHASRSRPLVCALSQTLHGDGPARRTPDRYFRHEHEAVAVEASSGRPFRPLRPACSPSSTVRAREPAAAFGEGPQSVVLSRL